MSSLSPTINLLDVKTPHRIGDAQTDANPWSVPSPEPEPKRPSPAKVRCRAVKSHLAESTWREAGIEYDALEANAKAREAAGVVVCCGWSASDWTADGKVEVDQVDEDERPVPVDGPTVVVRALVAECLIGEWFPGVVGQEHEFPLRRAGLMVATGKVEIVSPLTDRDRRLLGRIAKNDIFAKY